MGRLTNISGKEAIKAFQRAGWQVVGQVGTLRALIRNASMSVDEFLELL